MNARDRRLAMLLALIPGVGHLYLGLMRRGLQMLIFFFGSLSLQDVLGRTGGGIAGMAAPVLWFYNFFDTLQIVRRLNQGQPVEDGEFIRWDEFTRHQLVVGWVLVALGFLSLVRNAQRFFWFDRPPFIFFDAFYLAAVLIGLGSWLVWRGTRPPKAG